MLHTSHLIGAAALVTPHKPLLSDIAATQTGDATLSAIISKYRGGVAGSHTPPCRVAGHRASPGGSTFNCSEVSHTPVGASSSLPRLQPSSCRMKQVEGIGVVVWFSMLTKPYARLATIRNHITSKYKQSQRLTKP